MNKCFTCNEAINKNSTAKSEFSCNHKICTLCLLNLIKTKMCFQQKGAFSYKCNARKAILTFHSKTLRNSSSITLAWLPLPPSATVRIRTVNLFTAKIAKLQFANNALKVSTCTIGI